MGCRLAQTQTRAGESDDLFPKIQAALVSSAIYYQRHPATTLPWLGIFKTLEKAITNLDLELLLLVLVLYNLIVGTVLDVYASYFWPCIQRRVRLGSKRVASQSFLVSLLGTLAGAGILAEAPLAAL